MQISHKFLENLMVSKKVFSNEKSPVLAIYKQLDEIKNLQSVSVKEIFD